MRFFWQVFYDFLVLGNIHEKYSISIDKIYDDEFSLDYSLSNGSGCITEISGVVKLLSTDYENLEDNDIDQILLNINTNGMKFDVDIDALIKNIPFVSDVICLPVTNFIF